MKYYTNNRNLYSSNLPIIDESFVEISKEEYDAKLSELKANQDPVPMPEEDEWFTDVATETDYINALESLGVDFNG